jgi:hypothetical protein
MLANTSQKKLKFNLQKCEYKINAAEVWGTALNLFCCHLQLVVPTIVV